MTYSKDDIPVFYEDAARFVEQALVSMNIDGARMEMRTILEKRLHATWSDIQCNEHDQVVTDMQKQKIAQDLNARATGKPLSRIYKTGFFWMYDFVLNESTLDPRLDSETLIIRAMENFDMKAPIRILDMGTGTGCLLITLLGHYQNATGVGSDISAEALKAAKENGKLNKVDSRVQWIESDWTANIEGQFDLVISNPPYIRSEVIPELDENVRNYDPILALDGGEDGLQAYKKIFSELFSVLKPAGIALFEIGFDQAEDVMRLGEESRFLIKGVHADLAGQPRVVEMSCGDK